MKYAIVLASLCAQVTLGAISPKNFIFVVPDGLAPASITLARTYLSLLEGGDPGSPDIDAIAIDQTPVGNTRTHSSDDLVTDSAAAGTALATGFKTKNGAIGLLPDGQPIATILEAAKMKGLKTALVVTSIINHATPAAFSAHVTDRNDYDSIAAQQVGYSNHLNQRVDILLGGGRCYFKSQEQKNSCRKDNLDLFSFAEKKGYFVAQNRTQFDELKLGKGDIDLPYLGLFNDNHLSYEADRRLQPREEAEPSLSELTKTALNSLQRATSKSKKGFFMMIEASRIDHASHANDPIAHLHDVLEYNRVMEVITEWIDKDKQTAMLSVADHETGGITFPRGYDPRPLQGAQHSAEYWGKLWEDEKDKRSFLVDEILPSHGITNPSDSVIDAILKGDFEEELVKVTSSNIGMKWSTDDHSAVDTTLYAYAAGKMGRELKADIAGSHDNTELSRYIEKALGVDMDKATKELRKNWE